MFKYLVVFLVLSVKLQAQDSLFVKVHFLYGSKPQKAYKKTQSKWFGGKLGGHVGIELDSNQILNFIPKGKFHIIAHKKNRHSTYTTHNFEDFYSIMGGNWQENKKLIIKIPISQKQKEHFLCIQKNYLTQTPYDYAFLGIRCGAAAHDILGQLGILKHFSYRGTIFKVFYPKIVRRKLLKKAQKQGWQIQKQEGTKERKWEMD
ncbi:hypothetical protein AD998_08790 [bacterium 336/3]|nr:hypothetical protein AD998_08790 [bacterium 336/3]